jgi:hypothetical protein
MNRFSKTLLSVAVAVPFALGAASPAGAATTPAPAVPTVAVPADSGLLGGLLGDGGLLGGGSGGGGGGGGGTLMGGLIAACLHDCHGLTGTLVTVCLSNCADVATTRES